MIKAIFLDVDGTLFSHRISDIPASALEALDRLREKGILIFLATGRHRMALSRLNLHDFPFDGYVTLTGHLCYDRDWQPLLKQPLPPKDTEVLVKAFQEHRLPMILIQEEKEFLNYTDDFVLEIMGSVSTKAIEIVPYEPAPIYTAVIYSPPREAEAFIQELPGCRLSAWHPSGFDIISRAAGKVQGIEEVLRRFGLQREEIAVFGDGDNDVEMLSFAGTGVAMGNGTPAAKAAASFVTTDVDEDGLLNACKKLGLLD